MIDETELRWLGETPRKASYYAGTNGRSAAQIGIAAALARKSAPLAARTMPTVTATKAKANATNAKPRDRVKVVADAVANDPACKGKAREALCFLADPAFAGVTGEGIVKLLKAGATAELPVLAATTTTKAASAAKRSDALGGGQKPTKASASAWDNVIGRMTVRF